MPSYKLTQEARQKSARIRAVAEAFRRERVERVERTEDQGEIRYALQSVSASDFLAEVKR